MSQPGMQQNVETTQGGKVEKQSNLAPAAKKMLEGVFQQPQFEDFIKEIVDRANLLMKGQGTEIDKNLLLKEIDFQLQNTLQFGEAEGYARNYFQRLKEMVEGIEVKPASSN